MNESDYKSVAGSNRTGIPKSKLEISLSRALAHSIYKADELESELAEARELLKKSKHELCRADLPDAVNKLYDEISSYLNKTKEVSDAS